MQLIKQRFSYSRIDLLRDNCMLTQDRPTISAASEKETFDDPFIIGLIRKDEVLPVTKYETVKLEPKPQ